MLITPVNKFLFKAQTSAKPEVYSNTVELPLPQNDTFEPQNKERDKTKQKKYLAIAASIILPAIVFVMYRRHKIAKELEAEAKKDREKFEKELEESRKKIEEKLKAQIQKNIDELCTIYKIDEHCTSYNDIYRILRERNEKSSQEFKRKFAEAVEESERIREKMREESKNAREEFRRQQENFNNAWKNYQTKWQQANDDFRKKWEDIFNRYTTKTENNTNKTKSEHNYSNKTKTHTNYTYTNQTKDIEDYTGFTPSEINIIKNTNNTTPDLKTYVERNKNILARYLDIKEDDVLKLFNKDKSVYRKLALKWHPDRTHDETKEGRFKLATFMFNR